MENNLLPIVEVITSKLTYIEYYNFQSFEY